MTNAEFTPALSAIKKILIVGPAWIGDMMMAQSLYKLLKLSNPQVHISVLSLAWTRPLLALMPEVDHVIDMPLGHGAFDIKRRYQLGKKLRAEKFEQAILLPNSFKSALIPYFAKIPLRTGWRGEMRYGLLNDLRVLNKQKYPLMVQRYLALALEKTLEQNVAPLPEYLFPQLAVNLAEKNQLLKQFSLNLDKPVLVICPGAEYGPSKRWPENYYAEVVADKIGEGWQVWLVGSEKDKQITDALMGFLSENQQQFVKNIAGATSLRQAIELMTLSKAVITNDSGLMHIAAALKLPLVVVYGSTSPEHTPPLTNQVRIVTKSLDCSPCFERECPKLHHNCMKELMPQKVIAAINQLLFKANLIRSQS